MEENKNLEDNLSKKAEVEETVIQDDSANNQQIVDDNVEFEFIQLHDEDKEEEYYFTAADLRKQKKRQEQRLKRVAKEEKYRKRNLGRMYRSSAAIAVFAGIMQIIMGLPKEDGMTNIMLGATFICCGYLF